MLSVGPSRATTTAPDMNTRPLMILGYVESETQSDKAQQ